MSYPNAGKGIEICWLFLTITGIEFNQTLSDLHLGSLPNELPAFFTESVQYKNERYSVTLPWKDSEAKNKLLNNYHSASLRFENLKRRLARDEELSNKYHSVFVQLRSLGII